MVRNTGTMVMWAGLAAGTLASAAPADTIYRETFPYTGTGNATLTASGTGWSAHLSVSAGNYSSSPLLYVSSANGRPADAEGVNDSDARDPAAQGVVVNSTGVNNGPVIYWTSEYSFDLADFTLDSITWYQGNQSATESLAVVLQIGGTWYVADQGFTNPSVMNGSEFPTQAQLNAFTFPGQTWKTLNFTPGSTLSVGAPAALPTTGIVSAFGLFSPVHGNGWGFYQRFDTYEINATAVPEPASLALVGAALLLMSGRRER